MGLNVISGSHYYGMVFGLQPEFFGFFSVFHILGYVSRIFPAAYRSGRPFPLSIVNLPWEFFNSRVFLLFNS